MTYPWWYIPILTSPMLIALVSIIHVLISMYAVGGGIILAAENRRGIKAKDKPYREYWKQHAHFFMILSAVVGGVTGVGIWWTIGLASPLATETLIRTFVFGWGIEWVFFVLEITALFIFYYRWGQLPDKTHGTIGIIYALAAWISLVLITGITAFMLNSRGLFGDWLTTGSFWSAFFNKQFLPQTLARTGGSILLGSLYIWMHVTWQNPSDAVRERIIHRTAVWSLIGIGLLIAGVICWGIFLPKAAILSLQKAAALNIFLGIGGGALAAMILLIIAGPLRTPKKMTFLTALALFFFGIGAVATSEFVREAVRKPFIIDQVLYGNQVRPNEVESMRQNGFLASGVWTRLYLSRLQEQYPSLSILPPLPVSQSASEEITKADEENSSEMRHVALTQYRSRPANTTANTATNMATNTVASTETLAAPAPLNQSPAFAPTATVPMTAAANAVYSGGEDLLKMEPEDRIETGKVIFMYHCNDCHAPYWGYSAAGPMLVGKTTEEIVSFLHHLNRPGINMPPWCGNDAEAQLLAEYLTSIRPEVPNEEEPEEEVQETLTPVSAGDGILESN